MYDGDGRGKLDVVLYRSGAAGAARPTPESDVSVVTSSIPLSPARSIRPAPTAGWVLGFSTGRNAAAALLLGGRPVAAVEEAKLARSSGQAPFFPDRAVRYCLGEGGARAEDLAHIALSGRPRHTWFREQRQRARWGLLPVRSGLEKASRIEREVRRVWSNARFAGYEHQLCHAASAFFPSPFDRALVLTLDGGSDMCSGVAALGEGTALRVLTSSPSPHSCGWLYSRVTELLDYLPHRDEHKTQWLSADGAPDFLAAFRRLMQEPSQHGFPVCSSRFIVAKRGQWTLGPELLKALHLPAPGTPLDRSHAAAVARSLQDFVEESVVAHAERLRAQTGTRYLCVAGGVFLNTLLVRALEERAGFDAVFVQPAAGNAGSALGAAYLAGARRPADSGEPAASSAHLGPGFDDGQIKQVLDNCKLVYRYHESERRLLADTVALLERGLCVAWYQGRMEFGYRALGNRSILASPFSPYVADNLNHYVKHRDKHHPFVLSAPADVAHRYFDCTDNCRFAASVGRLKPSIPDLERFTIGGRRVRVHTVDRSVNRRLWDLLDLFGEKAPAPILVNTSFNLFGEPLVCDPRDAVRSFFCAGIDALVAGNFVVVK